MKWLHCPHRKFSGSSVPVAVPTPRETNIGPIWELWTNRQTGQQCQNFKDCQRGPPRYIFEPLAPTLILHVAARIVTSDSQLLEGHVLQIHILSVYRSYCQSLGFNPSRQRAVAVIKELISDGPTMPQNIVSVVQCRSSSDLVGARWNG